jgi:hypothetical protein
MQILSDVLERFCRKHHIRNLSFFVSVLTEDFRPDSDGDMLVEVKPQATSRAWPYYNIAGRNFGSQGGYKHTPNFLNRLLAVLQTGGTLIAPGYPLTLFSTSRRSWSILK